MELVEFPHRVLTRTLVIDKGQILLVRNKDGDFWYPPGGGWEPPESLSACAVREVYEETGYRVIIDGLVWVDEFIDQKKGTANTEIFWAAHLDDASNGQTPEHLETHKDADVNGEVETARWFGSSALKNMKVFPAKLQLIDIGDVLNLAQKNNTYLG